MTGRPRDNECNKNVVIVELQNQITRDSGCLISFVENEAVGLGSRPRLEQVKW